MGRSSSKPPPPSPTFSRAWRQIDWSQGCRTKLMEQLKTFELNDTNFNLRVVLCGPIGAGKSSFINSLNSVFQERLAFKTEAANTEGESWTKKYKSHGIKCEKGHLPFLFNDVMGLEKTEGGHKGGMHIDDVISALKGHIEDGYEFKPAEPLREGMKGYRANPSLSHKAHCLVSVLDADKITVMDQSAIDKLKKIREEATRLEIPQIVLMSKADTACLLVSEDLKKVYTSKVMKQRMEKCSTRLGVPMNCILPVKNYHEDGQMNTEQDVLLLTAMTQIVNFANDYVWNVQQCEGN